MNIGEVFELVYLSLLLFIYVFFLFNWWGDPQKCIRQNRNKSEFLGKFITIQGLPMPKAQRRMRKNVDVELSVAALVMPLIQSGAPQQAVKCEKIELNPKAQ